MATIEQEYARLGFLIDQGRGQEKAHLILIEEEARERIENKPDEQGKQKTQFRMETDSPDMYSRLNAQKDRWLRLIPNKSVCVDLLCRMWEEPSDAAIQAFGNDGEQETLGDA